MKEHKSISRLQPICEGISIFLNNIVFVACLPGVLVSISVTHGQQVSNFDFSSRSFNIIFFSLPNKAGHELLMSELEVMAHILTRRLPLFLRLAKS